MTGDVVGSLEIENLKRGYAAGTLSAAAVAEAVLARIAASGDDNVWIVREAADRLAERAAALDALPSEKRAAMPLYGVPFAVKDNIDVAGRPTTAGCAAFAYTPERSATVVERLLQAGAMLVGKTNLDQFATGLVGTRSPYGVPVNPFDARYVSGGSSSGSAVAVARGLVSFALGTDTAGSGRVPAAFNNVVGLKPTRGLISAAGVVPACRTLDCVSIFALTSDDAAAVLAVAAAEDGADPFSRAPSNAAATLPRPFRFGVPAESGLEFFGNADAAALFREAQDALKHLGGKRVEIDFRPFSETAALLYSGPWVAERLTVVEPLLARAPESLLPVTRTIIEGARRFSAVDAFRAMYRLAELKQRTRAAWDAIDVLVVPTVGTTPTLAEVEKDPIGRNSDLGYYTNFTNLLDLAAHAVPSGFQPDGLPVGITLMAPAFSDMALAHLAAAYQRRRALPLGATGFRALPRSEPVEAAGGDEIELVVLGAHMRGLPLSPELRALGARFVQETRTRPIYRLFALDGAPPERPGMLRVGAGEGVAIAAELWALTPAAFGAFVAAVPPPLSIGTVELEHGSAKGFLCEASATLGQRDISLFGGWRNYLTGKIA